MSWIRVLRHFQQCLIIIVVIIIIIIYARRACRQMSGLHHRSSDTNIYTRTRQIALPQGIVLSCRPSITSSVRGLSLMLARQPGTIYHHTSPQQQTLRLLKPVLKPICLIWLIAYDFCNSTLVTVVKSCTPSPGCKQRNRNTPLTYILTYY